MTTAATTRRALWHTLYRRLRPLPGVHCTWDIGRPWLPIVISCARPVRHDMALCPEHDDALRGMYDIGPWTPTQETQS